MGRPSAKPNSRESGEVKCLRPECERGQYQRGLCKNDHDTASRMVRHGDLTWAALEAAGKALPFKRSGPKPSPTQKWLLDGVDFDGCGQNMRDAVDVAVGAGMPPVEVWATVLRGFSKAGASKSISWSLARLRDRGVQPLCKCGRQYAEHPCVRECEKPADQRKRAPGSEVSPQPAQVRKLTPVLDSTGSTTAITNAVRLGMPLEEVMRTLRADRRAILRAVEAVTQEQGGGMLKCRCSLEYGHVRACLPPKQAAAKC